MLRGHMHVLGRSFWILFLKFISGFLFLEMGFHVVQGGCESSAPHSPASTSQALGGRGGFCVLRPLGFLEWQRKVVSILSL